VTCSQGATLSPHVVGKLRQEFRGDVVPETSAQERIFTPTKMMQLRILFGEESRGVYSPSIFVRTVEPKRVRQSGHVARMAENFGFENCTFGR
jgi:tRNA C32,U32 (ribose-2'-O)-methylase TrmJ